MKIYHATYADNVPSIRELGVCTRYSQSNRAAVWGVSWQARHWALAHVCKRHGWPTKPPVLIELNVPDDTVHHFRGSLHYSVIDWTPEMIVRVWTWDEICGSPVREKRAS